MDEKKQLKMCSNCNGQVDIDFEVCPYCGEEFKVQKPIKENVNREESIKSLSIEETLASLYPPPYMPRSSSPMEEMEEEEAKEEEKKSTTVVGKKRSLWPIAFLSIGINLALLGIIMFFFSHKGRLLVDLDSRFWFAYLIFSLPLMYLGYVKLSNEEK